MIDYRLNYDIDQIYLGKMYFGTWTLSESSLKIIFEILPLSTYTVYKISNSEIQLEQKVPADIYELFKGEAKTQKLILKR